MKALLIFVFCGLLALSVVAQNTDTIVVKPTTDTVIVVKPDKPQIAYTAKVTKSRVTNNEFNQLLQSLRKAPESIRSENAERFIRQP